MKNYVDFWILKLTECNAVTEFHSSMKKSFRAVCNANFAWRTQNFWVKTLKVLSSLEQYQRWHEIGRYQATWRLNHPSWMMKSIRWALVKFLRIAFQTADGNSIPTARLCYSKHSSCFRWNIPPVFIVSILRNCRLPSWPARLGQ